jgi:nucleoid DNA-binding protein
MTITVESSMARSPKAPDDSTPATPAKARTAKPKAAKPALEVVEDAPAKAPAGSGLKLKDLVESVASATGAKKPEAKKAVEATLAALSAALQAGTDLNLPPLGKLRVARSTGSVLTLKLRTKAGEKAGAKPLADDGEDD